MSTFTCQACGAAFELPPAVLAKYPGWVPRTCRSCRGPAPSKAARPASGTASRDYTPAEVLARFTAGPTTGVFTDGGASPNPGPGGWGVVWVENDVILGEASGHDPDTTNNRMELTALAGALRLVPRGTPVTVHADSELVVKTFTEWAATWERNGWRRKTGAIKNLDLVKPLHAEMLARPEVRLTWVPAHAGWRWNEYADALAGAWNRRAPPLSRTEPGAAGQGRARADHAGD